MKIPVGVSNRHVHLSKEVKDKLFGSDFELQIRRELKQKGEYSSESTIEIKGPLGKIERVRVMGPLRGYTQVEILKSDEDILGVKAPMRNSGDLEGSANLTLIGPNGEVYLENVCVISNRHIHMNEEDAKNFNVNPDDVVKVKKDNSLIDNVHIKIKPTSVLECHIDKDDGVKYEIENFDEVELIK